MHRHHCEHGLYCQYDREFASVLLASVFMYLVYLSSFYYPHFLWRALRPAKACVPSYSPLAAVTLRPSQWGQFCSGRWAAILSGLETVAASWPPPTSPQPRASRSRVLVPHLSSFARCERSDLPAAKQRMPSTNPLIGYLWPPL